QLGNQDLVTGAQARPEEAAGDEVDRLGGAAGEDDLLPARRAEELRHGVARGLVERRGALGEGVHAAVDVGAALEVVGRLGVEHGARLLRGSGVVEVSEGAAVDADREAREVAANALDVEYGARCGAVVQMLRFPQDDVGHCVSSVKPPAPPPRPWAARRRGRTRDRGATARTGGAR